jgi:hypothetical protein
MVGQLPHAVVSKAGATDIELSRLPKLQLHPSFSLHPPPDSYSPAALSFLDQKLVRWCCHRSFLFPGYEPPRSIVFSFWLIPIASHLFHLHPAHNNNTHSHPIRAACSFTRQTSILTSASPPCSGCSATKTRMVCPAVAPAAVLPTCRPCPA